VYRYGAPAPTINHVYAAIDTLYHTEGVEGKEDASKWLDQFQRSLYAWEISDQLLRQNRDKESQSATMCTLHVEKSDLGRPSVFLARTRTILGCPSLV